MNNGHSEHRPLLSIITVCYNAADNLQSTIESVDSQILDPHREEAYEHLIIDGASTDGTLKLLSEKENPRRRTVSETDNGIYYAMNKGLEHARGEYVMFLNAGDRLHGTNAIERILDSVGGVLLPGVIYGQTMLIDSEGHYAGERHLRAPERLRLNSFREGMVVCHQAFVALANIAQPFNTFYRFSADYDWCVRCLQHSRRNVYLGNEPIVEYLNEGMTTRNRRASLWERFRIMNYYFGLFPTIAHHFGFVVRYLGSRKGKARN